MFLETISCGPKVAFSVWLMMWKNAVFLDGSCILHFLWALMFMKDYEKSTTISTLAGTCPETFQRWI